MRRTTSRKSIQRRDDWLWISMPKTGWIEFRWQYMIVCHTWRRQRQKIFEFGNNSIYYATQLFARLQPQHSKSLFLIHGYIAGFWDFPQCSPACLKFCHVWYFWRVEGPTRPGKNNRKWYWMFGHGHRVIALNMSPALSRLKLSNRPNIGLDPSSAVW